jgi:hypothetical protein
MMMMMMCRFAAVSSDADLDRQIGSARSTAGPANSATTPAMAKPRARLDLNFPTLPTFEDRHRLGSHRIAALADMIDLSRVRQTDHCGCTVTSAALTCFAYAVLCCAVLLLVAGARHRGLW